ncbi:MAG: hypothetical protein ABEJ68_06590 [Halobacteriaceae archaeon]
MSDLQETAADVADDLSKSDVVVRTRPAVHRQVKRRVDVEHVTLDAVREGFAEMGWTYDRHLYFDPEAVAARAAELAATYRESEGRLVVSHDEVCDRLHDSEEEERQRVSGWNGGDFLDTVVDAFAERGWHTEVHDRQRVYQFPLYRVFEENHPNGRGGRSTAELFGDYVSTSMETLAEE